MSKQLNVRLPEATIERLNILAEVYGSQAKAVIAAIESLHKEHIMFGRTKVREVEVELSRQDLADFLDDNPAYMEAYRADLENRLRGYFRGADVDVSITHTLTDKFRLDGERDERGVIQDIMGQMANDLDAILDGID